MYFCTDTNIYMREGERKREIVDVLQLPLLVNFYLFVCTRGRERGDFCLITKRSIHSSCSPCHLTSLADF
jgi:hypothetical protein